MCVCVCVCVCVCDVENKINREQTDGLFLERSVNLYHTQSCQRDDRAHVQNVTTKAVKQSQISYSDCCSV